mgnify:CR=1 FL=1|tara:strand:- start:1410 stop:1808 length:399 start_codon:yes stop_codon:yes gene_type:complete
MEWIVVNPEGFLNSLERAKVITRELYNITVPVFEQTAEQQVNNLFSIITHPDDANEAALVVDSTYIIKVHPSCTLEKLVSVFPELDPDERFQLSSAIHQLGMFPFGLILPDSVTIRDEQYMIDNGWFEAEEI